jgi:hypothetical protein
VEGAVDSGGGAGADKVDRDVVVDADLAVGKLLLLQDGCGIYKRGTR